MGAWLPGAPRDPKNDGGAFTRAARVGVIHSTEGGSWPAYDSGQGVAPHLTVDVIAQKTVQHIPFDRAARALRNESGGVETNRSGAIQIELIGTCDVSLAVERSLFYLPAMNEDAVNYLAALLARIHVDTGVPLSTSVKWRDYNGGQPPSSYGRDNDVRLNAEQWRGYAGWLGHMHVPENVHGDPGSIPIARILDRAQTIMATTTMSIPVVIPAEPVASVTPLPAPPVAPRETPADVPADPRAAMRGKWPLPLGHWFGPESRDGRVHSGYYVSDALDIKTALAALRQRGWRNVPDVDRYTPAVVDLVTRYQADAGLKRDGKLGRDTWVSIASSTVR